MSIWVHSQDKLGLFELKGFRIREHSFENGTKEYLVLNNDNLYNHLGTYKSRERALEVLDEIQAFLENNYLSIDDMPQHNNNPWIDYCPRYITRTAKTVYQMPKE